MKENHLKIAAKAFLKRINTLRKESKIDNNADFANLIGTSEATVRRWKSGKSLPSWETIGEVDQLLEARLEELRDLVAAVANAIPKPF